MKRNKIIFAALIFLSAACSGGDTPPSDAVQHGEIKEAELTLELTLGGADDKNTDEFLLAVPEYLMKILLKYLMTTASRKKSLGVSVKDRANTIRAVSFSLRLMAVLPF